MLSVLLLMDIHLRDKIHPSLTISYKITIKYWKIISIGVIFKNLYEILSLFCWTTQSLELALMYGKHQTIVSTFYNQFESHF